MNLTAIIGQLGAASQAEVLTLWDAHLAGRIDEETLVVAVAAVIDRYDARATTVADWAMAVAVGAELGRAVAPVGLPILSSQTRLRDAVRTVLAADIASATTPEQMATSRAARLARLARADPAGTAQDAAGLALQRHPVRGWVRTTSGRACRLCRGWADGIVRPATVRMIRHTGCGCSPRPVVA